MIDLVKHNLATCFSERPIQLVIGALVIGIYCSAVFVLGGQLEANSAFEWRMLTLAKILGFAILAAIPGGIVLRFCLKRNGGGKSNAIAKAFGGGSSEKSDFCSHFKAGHFRLATKHKAISLICMVVPQIVVLLIMFPGAYAYDGAYHILQYLDGDTQITSQYSVIYTVYLGFFVSIGQSIDNVQLTFGIAMLLQACINILVLYKCLNFVACETASRLAWAATLIFFSVFPCALFLRVSSSQDVLFATFFLAALVELTKLGKKLVGNEKITVKEAVPYIAFSVLYMLMRNNGVYALAVCAVLLLPLAIKSKGWRIFAVIVVPAFLYLLINGPIYSAFGIGASEHTLREMSSIPSQQIVRAVETDPEEISQEEFSIFAQAYNWDAFDYVSEGTSWYWTQSEISDVAKAGLNEDFVKNNLAQYLQLWINVGLKAPKSYIEAFAMNSLGFWYPAKTYPDARMYHPYVEYNTTAGSSWNAKYIDIPRSSLLPNVDELVSVEVYGKGWSNSSFSIVLKSGFYFLLFVICLVACKYVKRRDLYPLLYLVGGLIVTLFLAPVCLFRYVYPLILSTPLLFLVFYSAKGNSESEDGIADVGVKANALCA